jgi:hypothetical protein
MCILASLYLSGPNTRYFFKHELHEFHELDRLKDRLKLVECCPVITPATAPRLLTLMHSNYIGNNAATEKAYYIEVW